MRWKNFGKTKTVKYSGFYLSGKKDKHEHGIWFLIHKDIMNTVMGCRPVSSRLITIRLRAAPFNITVVKRMPQRHSKRTMTMKLKNSRASYRMSLIRPQRTLQLCKETGMYTSIGKDAHANWQGIHKPFCNDKTNERGGLKTPGVCHA